ncbi:NUDIX domain-containing protein [Dermacoccus nishinomiyaensis]|uniref:NUDIX hydrolase n=1 Tax=Dermacoccus TaxID=57495 RepID=UPI000ED6A4F7|nr:MULTISPECIES: NUDIX domain-containing protein [Dermacoccus]TJZ98064.1 NUDIX domain-containing protein [Dermacoccus nishinomiyaensis]HCQ18447.1 NUDIX hydrolase [Dermacoccus sp.]
MVEEKLIRVAAVVFRDERGRVLTVRKRGTERFMLPGGKLEDGETFAQTASREVEEELGLVVSAAELEPLGTYRSDAANEPGFVLESHVFTYPGELAQTPRVAAEIAEMQWFTEAQLRDPEDGVLLAPMLQFNAVPAIFD